MGGVFCGKKRMALTWGDEVYNKLYPGWGRAEAEADFRATGGRNKAGYQQLTDPVGWQQQQQQQQQQQFLQDQETRRQAELASQKQQEQDFLGRYQTAIKGQEPIDAMFQRLSTQYQLPQLQARLPELQQNAMSLQQTLFQLPQEARTRQERYGGMDEAQRKAFIGERQAELAPSASLAEQNYQAALGNYNQAFGNVENMLKYNVAQQQKELQPLTTEASMMSDRLARQMTSYSQEQQSQLDLYLQQLSSNQQLSLAQMQHANELAIKEQDYQNQLKLLETKGAQDIASQELSGQQNIALQRAKNEALKSVGKYGNVYLDDNGNPVFVGSGAGSSRSGGTNYFDTSYDALPSYFTPIG